MGFSRSAGSSRRAARVAVALGSNLGDRRGHLTWAFERLADLVSNLRISAVVETDPVDVPDDQPPYLNAVAVGETRLEPRALLEALLALEARRGRTRRSWRAARTLDLDLILYDGLVFDAPDVTLPHPRFRERAFVVGLLADIVPDWVDPVTRKTMRELAAALRGPDGVSK
jgi:2-amino-4-hydroxy-6-hydroxymethyldihydropteridine diphosphokinase